MNRDSEDKYSSLNDDCKVCLIKINEYDAKINTLNRKYDEIINQRQLETKKIKHLLTVKPGVFTENIRKSADQGLLNELRRLILTPQQQTENKRLNQALQEDLKKIAQLKSYLSEQLTKVDRAIEISHKFGSKFKQTNDKFLELKNAKADTKAVAGIKTTLEKFKESALTFRSKCDSQFNQTINTFESLFVCFENHIKNLSQLINVLSLKPIDVTPSQQQEASL